MTKEKQLTILLLKEKLQTLTGKKVILSESIRIGKYNVGDIVLLKTEKELMFEGWQWSPTGKLKLSDKPSI